MCLARGLMTLGFEIDVICKQPNPKVSLHFVPISEFCPSGYDIVHAHAQYGLWNFKLRHNGSRIVHTYHGVLLAALLARGASKTILRHPRYYLPLIIREIMSGLFSHRLIAVSNAVMKQAISYYRIPPSKISVIHNGYSLTRVSNSSRDDIRRSLRAEFGIRSDEFVYLYVGRADPVKGIERTLDAFTKIHSQYANTRLVLVPGFPAENRDAIISTGNLFVEDVWDLYFMADSLVNSSFYEGFPVCIPEAMATGLPVIAPRVGGIVDIVQDGVNGILVDKACEGLAGAMKRVYLDLELRARLSKQALASVRRLSWADIATRTAEIYKSVING